MILVILPLIASLAAWMLSGSPAPMGLSILVLLVAAAGRPAINRLDSLWPAAILAVSASLAQWWLFRSGFALTINAVLPDSFHLGMGLLWFASVSIPVAGSADRWERAATAIGGGFLVLGAAIATELYEYGPWQVYPVAALPLAATLVCLFPTGSAPAPWKVGSVLLLPIAVTGTILAVQAGTVRIESWLDGGEENEEAVDLSQENSAEETSASRDGASRRIPRKADVRFTEDIQIYMQTPAPELFRTWIGQPLYVRTYTLATFESDEVVSPVRSARWIYDSDDGADDESIELQRSSGRRTANYTVFIGRSGADTLPVIEGSTRLLAHSVYEFADDWYQLSPTEQVTHLRYTAATLLETPARADESDGSLRQIGAPGIYLQLPPSPLAARIAGLSRRFDSDEPLREIRNFMQERMKYSLQFETPAEENPIEQFLFHGQAGHCEHFATSTVMILRSLGIPCRIAFGYAGGAADQSQNLIAFRDSHFHAWAEILTPEGNWTVFDTTPTVDDSAPRTAIASNVPALAPGLYYDYSQVDVAEEGFGPRLADVVMGLIAMLSRHFYLVTALGFVLVAGVWTVAFRKSKKNGEGGSGQRLSPAESPAPDFLHVLEATGNAIGLPRPPGNTWKEYLDRLAEIVPLSDSVREAIDYHYAVAYAGRPRLPERERILDREIRSWRSTLARD